MWAVQLTHVTRVSSSTSSKKGGVLLIIHVMHKVPQTHISSGFLCLLFFTLCRCPLYRPGTKFSFPLFTVTVTFCHLFLLRSHPQNHYTLSYWDATVLLLTSVVPVLFPLLFTFLSLVSGCIVPQKTTVENAGLRVSLCLPRSHGSHLQLYHPSSAQLIKHYDVFIIW